MSPVATMMVPALHQPVGHPGYALLRCGRADIEFESYMIIAPVWVQHARLEVPFVGLQLLFKHLPLAYELRKQFTALLLCRGQ